MSRKVYGLKVLKSLNEEIYTAICDRSFFIEGLENKPMASVVIKNPI